MIDKYGTQYYNAGMASTERSTYKIGGTFIIVLESVLVNEKACTEVNFVNCSKFTDFGLSVKTKLLQNGKNQKWLEEAVSEKTGLYLDNGYMYKILTGQRSAPQIVAAICEILSIKEKQ